MGLVGSIDETWDGKKYFCKPFYGKPGEEFELFDSDLVNDGAARPPPLILFHLRTAGEAQSWAESQTLDFWLAASAQDCGLEQQGMAVFLGVVGSGHLQGGVGTTADYFPEAVKRAHFGTKRAHF